MNAKPGRNEPCLCGSGRKYKHCCGSPPGAVRRNPEKSFELGSAALSARRFCDAEALLRDTLGAAPDFVEAHVNLGNALRGLRRPEEALRSFRRALELRPSFHALRLNVGVCLDEMGRGDEAIDAYREALSCGPPNAQLLHNLGIALRNRGRLEEARSELRRAVALDPTSEASALALGGVLLALRDVDEAAAFLERAAAALPHCADLHASLGNALLALGCVEAAEVALRRAAELDPLALEARSSALMAMLYRERGDSARIEAARRDFAARFEAPLRAAIAPHRNVAAPERPIRVGYVSGDLRSHSVAYFFEPALARHDRKSFSIHCYQANGATDAVTDRLRRLADGWTEAVGMTDEQLARRVRDDGIDILVDLSGHTAGNRLLAFARRPAPVQVSWIGYPDDTGLAAIDGMLSDAVASPRDGGRFGSSAADRWLRLPRIFSCYRPPTAAAAPSERDPGAEVRFCSFNNVAKISDETLAAWARILRELPDSRLALKHSSFSGAKSRGQLLERFERHGIHGGRLELLARVASDEAHLALYGNMDIALDTFPYNGVTTTCEALWMGVPVVSLAGAAFRARMGATLLASVGHPEWVAGDADGYVATAIGLARATEHRRALRARLRAEMSASPLMDEAGVTREVEACYRELWRGWCDSQRRAGRSG